MREGDLTKTKEKGQKLTRAQLYREAWLTLHPEDKGREQDFNVADAFVPESNQEIPEEWVEDLRKLALLVIKASETMSQEDMNELLKNHVSKN